MTTPTVRIQATVTLGGGNRSSNFRAVVDGVSCGHSHRTVEAAQACAKGGKVKEQKVVDLMEALRRTIDAVRQEQAAREAAK